LGLRESLRWLPCSPFLHLGAERSIHVFPGKLFTFFLSKHLQNVEMGLILLAGRLGSIHQVTSHGPLKLFEAEGFEKGRSNAGVNGGRTGWHVRIPLSREAP